MKGLVRSQPLLNHSSTVHIAFPTTSFRSAFPRRPTPPRALLVLGEIAFFALLFLGTLALNLLFGSSSTRLVLSSLPPLVLLNLGVLCRKRFFVLIILLCTLFCCLPEPFLMFPSSRSLFFSGWKDLSCICALVPSTEKPDSLIWEVFFSMCD